MAPGRILVTGAASGIGAEVARLAAEAGLEVVAIDIAPPEADHIAHVIPADLGDPASVTQAAQAAAALGPYDALCNVAGLPPRDGLSALILRVNFLSLRQLTLALLPALAPGGAVVNVSSKAGAGWRENLDQVRALMALPEDADLRAFLQETGIDPTRAYNLSKEAVTVWTMAMTGPLVDRGLRMNSVSPAAVSTGILDDFARAFGDRMQANVARVGRPGTATEIAHVVMFLASAQSGWLKGIDIPIDGGMGAIFGSEAMGITAP